MAEVFNLPDIFDEYRKSLYNTNLKPNLKTNLKRVNQRLNNLTCNIACGCICGHKIKYRLYKINKINKINQVTKVNPQKLIRCRKPIVKLQLRKI